MNTEQMNTVNTQNNAQNTQESRQSAPKKFYKKNYKVASEVTTDNNQSTPSKFNKKPYKFNRDRTPEEKVEYENKKCALNLAQEILLNECYNVCSEKFCEDVQRGVQYVVGFKATRRIDLTNDNISVDYNDKQYTFSKRQFLENKTFQYKVREMLKPYMPNAWITFFAGKDSNFYYIGFYPIRQ